MLQSDAIQLTLREAESEMEGLPMLMIPFGLLRKFG